MIDDLTGKRNELEESDWMLSYASGANARLLRCRGGGRYTCHSATSKPIH
jgi:hypothetical protein